MTHRAPKVRLGCVWTAGMFGSSQQGGCLEPQDGGRGGSGSEPCLLDVLSGCGMLTRYIFGALKQPADCIALKKGFGLGYRGFDPYLFGSESSAQTGVLSDYPPKK